MARCHGAVSRGLMMLALALALLPGRAPAEDRAQKPPADPASAAAYAVLEKHCARCHQAERLERPAPAGAFGNILRLDELAATPSLVQPGSPDASRLYLMMLRRLMPLDAAAEGTAHAWPTPDEIAHVRTWITGLPPREPCRAPPVTSADHAATLLRLRQVTGEDPKKLRFLSIAHLHNACAGAAALAAYGQAIVRAVNSLSWKTAPIAVPPVDPARTLFKINLDDLGWRPEHWDRMMRSGGSPLGLTAPLPEDIRQIHGTEVPVARADWFARTVLSAPLYYEVLGLPGSEPEILKTVQTAPEATSTNGQRPRASIARPSFSVQPNVIERHQSGFGPIWRAYHWLAGEQVPDISPDTVPVLSDLAPAYHAARGWFTLPNGLPGFFVADQAGNRLDALPQEIASPSSAGRSTVTAGLDCMACHRGGPAPANTIGLPAPVAHALAADRKAIADAMRRIGIDPELTLDGVAPVVALATAYARPLDGARAAAELGVDRTALLDLADRGSDPASILARRLVQGLVARPEVEAHAGSLATALGRPRLPVADAGRPPTPGEERFTPLDAGPGLILYSDKARYRKGDDLQITVKAAVDCHLTVISIDTRGRGTVLFPSDFEAESRLAAGQALELPGPGAHYKLRLNETGRETIVALCNEAGPLTDNIHYDFERQRFTELGDYAAFVSRNALIDPAKAHAIAPPPASPPRRGRRRHVAAEAAQETHARPDQVSRTAISIVIE